MAEGAVWGEHPIAGGKNGAGLRKARRLCRGVYEPRVRGIDLDLSRATKEENLIPFSQ
jgi:hypothetical protein